MFSALINFFVALWGGVKSIWQAMWNYVKSGYFWIIGILVALIALIVDFTNWLTALINDVATAIGHLVMPSHSVTQATGDLLATANYVFPVTETFICIIAISTLWGVAMLIRFLKWLREIFLP